MSIIRIREKYSETKSNDISASDENIQLEQNKMLRSKELMNIK